MNRQWISAILMTAVGGCIFAVSDLYIPQPAVSIISQTEAVAETPQVQESFSEPRTTENIIQETEETPNEFQPSLEELNLAYYFPEGEDINDHSKSYAGKAFIELMMRDGLWMNSIYDYADMTPEQLASRLGQPRSTIMGAYNPKDDKHDPNNPDTWTINSFRNIRTNVINGDGQPISTYSNVIEIMSLASVYSYYKDTKNYDLFLSYAKALWDASHFYSVSMSEIYYCDGCLSEEDERARLEQEAKEEEEAVKRAAAKAEEEARAAQRKSGLSQISGSEDEQTKSSSSVITSNRRTTTTTQELNTSDSSDSGKEISDWEGHTESQANNENDSGQAVVSTKDTTADSYEIPVNSEASVHSETTMHSEAASEEIQEQDSAKQTTQESYSTSDGTSVIVSNQGREVVSGGDATSENSTSREGSTGESFSENFANEDGAAQNATPSDAAESESTQGTDRAAPEPPKCPGHVDLVVGMQIRGIKEENGLFKRDPTGNNSANFEDNGWQGWTPEAMEAARFLGSQDWYQKYGLTVSAFSMRNPLTGHEIEEYMGHLPDNLSETRKNLIRFALSSVGKVPYYWGGKPSAPNYSRNNFGTLITPDEKGRILRGLDCSGWINWVYWSVTGNRLPYEGTSGLALCGAPVSRDNLQPGDIIIRTGENAHVIMFLEWTEDGRIRCIHESSGDVNNVTVAVRDANWPYYRKLID